MDLAGKLVLITQAHLSRYMGSEIVTLELTEYFVSQGARVLVVSHGLGTPLITEFLALDGATVLDLSDPRVNEFLSKETPALAWIQHSIIPRAVLEHATETVFVFNHMSSILPSEYSLNAALESELASLILFESPQSEELQRKNGAFASTIGAERFQVLGNPAPDSFRQLAISNLTSRILVVSNHIPAELVEALDILRQRQDVTIVGGQSELGAVARRVTPELISESSVVITIGKTVQYSMLAGVPVYCYDHFGGPGWLTEDNYSRARHHNFSGRGFDRKAAEEIAREIESFNAGDAAEYRRLSSAHHSEISLSSRLDALLTFLDANRRAVSVLTPEQIAAHSQVQDAFGSYVKEWMRSVGDVAWLTERELALTRRIEELEGQLQSIQSDPVVRLGARLRRFSSQV